SSIIAAIGSGIGPRITSRVRACVDARVVSSVGARVCARVVPGVSRIRARIVSGVGARVSRVHTCIDPSVTPGIAGVSALATIGPRLSRL
ncbi:MAG: hypothetical protein JST92_25115, partial [Deltaproteobacteria bacterium]|nr:hypothetical protein [Deltaproteobacteria bacterium]